MLSNQYWKALEMLFHRADARSFDTEVWIIMEKGETDWKICYEISSSSEMLK